MRFLNSLNPFLLIAAFAILFTGCADHSPKAGEGSSHADKDANRIMVEHGVHRTTLAKDLRSLLTEAKRYVGKICIRLKSKCPEEPNKPPAGDSNSPEDSNSAEKGLESGDGDEDTAEEGENDEQTSHSKSDENDGEEEDGDAKHVHKDKAVHNTADGDNQAISATVEAGVEPKKEQPPDQELSKEANELLDVIFELGQSYPSLIPSLKDASTWIVEDYKRHESETSENVELYIPFQLLRMYFDLVLKIKAQTDNEPLSPELLHVYSLDAFEILRSVMFYVSKTRDPHFRHSHTPHEIEAMTKASKLLEPLKTSSDKEDNPNIARRIVVKIFLGIADMFVLVRGTVHNHKLSVELVHLYDACVTHLESVPEILETHLMATNDLKNQIWLARSEVFKTGKLGDEHKIHKLTETVGKLVEGQLREDGTDVHLTQTASFNSASSPNSGSESGHNHEDDSEEGQEDEGGDTSEGEGDEEDEGSEEADDSEGQEEDTEGDDESENDAAHKKQSGGAK